MKRIAIILGCSALVASTASAEELWKSDDPLANFHLKAHYRATGNGKLVVNATDQASFTFPLKARNHSQIYVEYNLVRRSRS